MSDPAKIAISLPGEMAVEIKAAGAAKRLTTPRNARVKGIASGQGGELDFDDISRKARTQLERNDLKA